MHPGIIDLRDCVGWAEPASEGLFCNICIRSKYSRIPGGRLIAFFRIVLMWSITSGIAASLATRINTSSGEDSRARNTWIAVHGGQGVQSEGMRDYSVVIVDIPFLRLTYQK